MKSGYLEQYWIFKPGILELSGTMSNSWNQDICDIWNIGDSHGPCEHLGSSPQWAFFHPGMKVKAGWNDCKKKKQHELFGDLPDLLVESGTFTDFFWSQNESLVLVSDGIMTWHGNLLWTGDGIIPSSCQYLSLDLHSCWVNSCEIPKLIQITSSRFFGLPVYPLYKLWSHCSYFRIWFYQVFPLGGWTHQLLFAHQLDFPIWTREKLISATIHTYIYIYNQYHCIYIYTWIFERTRIIVCFACFPLLYVIAQKKWDVT